MTAKEELNQYKYKRKKADETLEEYQKYKTRAEKMTSIISDVPSRTNKNSDKVGDNASIMVDLEKQYEEMWIESEYERLEIEKRINQVEEPYRTLLHMRYIEDLPLMEVATRLNYKSYTYACEQHGIALKKFEENRTQPKTSE